MSNIDSPTVKVSGWTPINQPTTAGHTYTIGITTSPAETASALTDQQILEAELAQVTDERLLQVAGTHTNKEIVDKLNAHHGEETLSYKSLTNRLHRSTGRVAKSRGVSQAQVRKQLHDLRENNDVMRRMHASRSETRMALNAAKAAKSLESDTPDSEEVESRDDMEVGGASRVSEAEDDDESLELLLNECNEILRGNSALLIDRTLLKVAGVFTNIEIAHKVNAAGSSVVFTSRVVSERLGKALCNVAKREGKTRAETKGELEQERRTNGVSKRMNKEAASRRIASKAARKAVERQGIDADTIMDEKIIQSDHEDEDDPEDDDNEDLLDDLEDMVRQGQDGTLSSDGEPSRVTYPIPFSSTQIGYLADEEARYVPGFRLADNDESYHELDGQQ